MEDGTFNKLFSRNKTITTKMGCLLLLMLALTYIIIFTFPKLLGNTRLKHLVEFCVIEHKGLKDTLKPLRGEEYFYRDKKMNPGNCIMTAWELSHILYHMIIGYFFDIYVSTFLSVGFEYYEYKYFKCHSYLDLIYNFTGAAIGRLISIKTRGY